jgi:hypothetical protein
LLIDGFQCAALLAVRLAAAACSACAEAAWSDRSISVTSSLDSAKARSIRPSNQFLSAGRAWTVPNR